MRVIVLALTIVLAAFSSVTAETVRRVGVTALYLRPNPAEPGYGQVVSVQAFIKVDAALVTSATLVIFWSDAGANEPVRGEQVAIDPKDLTINAALTKATLKLPDGSMLTWVAAPGEYSTDDSSNVTHRGHTTSRYAITTEHRYSTVSGTLGPDVIDSGALLGRVEGGEVAIWRQLERSTTTTKR